MVNSIYLHLYLFNTIFFIGYNFYLIKKLQSFDDSLH